MPDSNFSQNSSRHSSALSWIALFIFTLAWFLTLDYRHLIPSDEGRYAEMAREMLVSGDWITPRYNDYLYFEKPPLQIWATAIIFKLFGLGEWQARFWSALSSYLTILFITFTANRLYGWRTKWLAPLILLSSPMWIVGGHFNALDMGLSAFLNLSLCSLLLSQHELQNQEKKSARNWMWLCWLGMALATLSKGLIGAALPCLVLLVYSLSTWNWRIWKDLQIPSGLGIFLIITAPWFILISIQNPIFPEFFFIREHVQRFTQDAHQRTGAIYYFVPLLAVGFLPWLAQLPWALGNAWQSRKRGTFSAEWMLLCWFISIFVFFSVSRSKLPGYIIPIFPALALLVVAWLNRSLIYADRLPNLWRWQAILFTLFGIGGFFFLPQMQQMARPDEVLSYQNYQVWIGIALACMILACIATYFLARRHGLLSIAVYSIGFFLTATIAGTGHETLGRAVSGFDLAQQVKHQIPKDSPIYSVRILDHTMPFYLERTMIMVEAPDELEFGVQQQPDKWAPTLAEFIERWNRQPQAIALMVPEQYSELKKMGLPMEELGRDQRRVMVRHPAPALRQ